MATDQSYAVKLTLLAENLRVIHADAFYNVKISVNDRVSPHVKAAWLDVASRMMQWDGAGYITINEVPDPSIEPLAAGVEVPKPCSRTGQTRPS